MNFGGGGAGGEREPRYTQYPQTALRERPRNEVYDMASTNLGYANVQQLLLHASHRILPVESHRYALGVTDRVLGTPEFLDLLTDAGFIFLQIDAQGREIQPSRNVLIGAYGAHQLDGIDRVPTGHVLDIIEWVVQNLTQVFVRELSRVVRMQGSNGQDSRRAPARARRQSRAYRPYGRLEEDAQRGNQPGPMYGPLPPQQQRYYAVRFPVERQPPLYAAPHGPPPPPAAFAQAHWPPPANPPSCPHQPPFCHAPVQQPYGPYDGFPLHPQHQAGQMPWPHNRHQLVGQEQVPRIYGAWPHPYLPPPQSRHYAPNPAEWPAFGDGYGQPQGGPPHA